MLCECYPAGRGMSVLWFLSMSIVDLAFNVVYLSGVDTHVLVRRFPITFVFELLIITH